MTAVPEDPIIVPNSSLSDFANVYAVTNATGKAFVEAGDDRLLE